MHAKLLLTNCSQVHEVLILSYYLQEITRLYFTDICHTKNNIPPEASTSLTLSKHFLANYISRLINQMEQLFVIAICEFLLSNPFTIQKCMENKIS